MNMTKNAGTTDRALRAIVGIALIALTFTGHLGAWGWIGIVPLVTALIGWCPAYTLFGFKTCKDCPAA
jgi:hypothetical protein